MWLIGLLLGFVLETLDRAIRAFWLPFGALVMVFVAWRLLTN